MSTPLDDTLDKGLPRGPAPSARLDAIRALALAEVARAPAPRGFWRDALVLLAVNLAVAVAGTAMMSRHQGQHASELVRWGLGAAWLVVMTLGAVAALRPGASPWRWGLGLAAAVTGALAVVGGSGSGADAPLLAGLGCARAELLLSLGPTVVALWALSGFAPSTGRTVVAALAAGAGGVFALHFHCSIGTPSHLALFHVLPWGVAVGVAVVARRFVKSRTFAP